MDTSRPERKITHDVFISYSSLDKRVADAGCNILEHAGIRCWVAPRDIHPGLDYAESIVDGIDGARMLLLVLSANSNQSHFVKLEVERAVSKGLMVMPVRIEDVLPSRALELFVSSRHWLDAMPPPIEEHFTKLAQTIRTVLGITEPKVEPPKEPDQGPPTTAPKSDPLLVFEYTDRGWVLRNLGTAPALDILVAQKRVGGGWFKPVRIPPLEVGRDFLLTWCLHANDTGLGASYASSDGAVRSAHCGNDRSTTHAYSILPTWTEDEIERHWDVKPYVQGAYKNEKPAPAAAVAEPPRNPQQPVTGQVTSAQAARPISRTIAFVVTLLLLFAGIAYFATTMRTGTTPSTAFEILDAGGKPFPKGSVVPARRLPLAREANGELWHNGLEFSFAVRKPAGSAEAPGDIELYYKADAPEKTVPSPGSLRIEPGYDSRKVNGYDACVPASDTPPHTHKVKFLLSSLPDIKGSPTPENLARFFVGAGGVVPEGQLPVRLKVWDASHKHILAEQDLTLAVPAAPSPFRILGRDGQPLRNNTVFARRVQAPSPNGVSFALTLEGPKENLLNPVVVTHHLKSVPLPAPADRQAAPGTLTIGKSMGYSVEQNPELQKNGYTVSNVWNLRPDDARPSETTFPIFPQFFAGSEGRIGPGDHDMFIEVTSAGRLVYSGEIKVNVWELEPVDEMVELYSVGELEPDTEVRKRTQPVGAFWIPAQTDEGNGLMMNLVVKNLSKNQISELDGTIYFNANASDAPAPRPDWKLTLVPGGKWPPSPIENPATGAGFAYGGSWHLEGSYGQIPPGEKNGVLMYGINLGTGGAAQKGEHEIGMEVRLAGRPVYRGFLLLNLP